MSYLSGYYSITNDEKQYSIRPFNANSSDKRDKVIRVLVLTIGMLLAGAFTFVGYRYGSIAHAILFFFVAGIGGFYVLWNLTKRSEMKYFSVIVDDTGIHEKWNYPNKPTVKTIGWNELRFCKCFREIVFGPGNPAPRYDCLVFSKAEQDEKFLNSHIRNVYLNHSMDYELKFRDDPNSIFIIIESHSGIALYEEMLQFALSHNGSVVKDCDRSSIDFG